VTRVRLVATDADMKIGEGPEVTGTALALLLAVSGRHAVLGDLDGPGAGALAPSAGG
jgi:hypothetical protein